MPKHYGAKKVAVLNANKMGIEAAKSGVVVGDNPFEEHTTEHWAWMDGWIVAIKAMKGMNNATV